MLISTKQFKSETQKNGERVKRACRRWAGLLDESKKFAPIKTKSSREATAMLLDNQYRYLTEAATNTSIFGPQNGLTGGALAATDGYAPGDNRLPKMLIPMVRRIYPALMSNETVGVQPMPGPVALGFALRYRYLRGANVPADSATKHVHDVKAEGDPATVNAQMLRSRGIKGVYTTGTLTLVSVPGTEQMWMEEAGKATDEILKEVYIGLAHTAKTLGKAIGRATLTLIDEQHYPRPQKVLYTLDDDRKTTHVIPFGYKFVFDAEVTKAEIEAGTAVKTTQLVGISEPVQGNTHIDHKNSEMGWQRLDTRFTGRQSDELSRKDLANGRWRFRPEDTGIAALMQQFEGTGAVAKTSFGFEKKSVEAGTRRLSTSWTLETEEDLKNTNGIDIESEATQQMSYELQAEIDREMTIRMLYAALSHNEWSLWDAQLADARWGGERQRMFYNHLIKMSIRMQVRNHRGPANFIVCTPDVAAVLEQLEDFVVMPASTSVTTGNMATAKVGTLGGNRFSVYVDTRTPVYDSSDYGAGYDELFDADYKDAAGKPEQGKLPNYCLLGYKGTEAYDAGIIYCPYIPIMVMQATDPHSFEPQVGLMTRYGVLDNLFGSELYYHVIIVDSFSQPGTPENLRHIYPAGYITPELSTKATDPVTGEDVKNYSYAFPVNDLSKKDDAGE